MNRKRHTTNEVVRKLREAGRQARGESGPHPMFGRATGIDRGFG